MRKELQGGYGINNAIPSHGKSRGVFSCSRTEKGYQGKFQSFARVHQNYGRPGLKAELITVRGKYVATATLSKRI